MAILVKKKKENTLPGLHSYSHGNIDKEHKKSQHFCCGVVVEREITQTIGFRLFTCT